MDFNLLSEGWDVFPAVNLSPEARDVYSHFIDALVCQRGDVVLGRCDTLFQGLSVTLE